MKKIADLGLAAYLVANFPLLTIEVKGTKGLFCFPSSPELEAECYAYYNRAGVTVALTYHENVRNLKAAIEAARGHE